MAKRKPKRKPITVEAVEVDISELTFDPNNANRGTERGDYMLGKSAEKHGAARGVVVDKNLVIVAGNKTTAKMGENDVVQRVLLIPSDGRTLVATMREDWDIAENDGVNPARDYAFGDNRVGEVNYDPDEPAIIDAVDAGVDVGDYWFDDEIAEIRANVGSDDGENWDDYADPPADNVAYRVIVDGLERVDADRLLESLTGEWIDNGRVEQYRVNMG